MKTYPDWRRPLSWHERFIKRSIKVNIHTKYHQLVLGRFSALFFRQLAAMSICLCAASFQVCAVETKIKSV